MSTELFRKYIDIVNENQQPTTQLFEGVAQDPAAQKAVAKVAATLTPQEEQQLKAIAQQAQGDPIKAAKLLGLTSQDAAQAVNEDEHEGWGIAPGLKGKVIQALHLAAVGGGVAAMAGVGGAVAAPLAIAGVLALMFADTVWGKNAGQVADPQQRDHADYGVGKGTQWTAKSPAAKAGPTPPSV